MFAARNDGRHTDEPWNTLSLTILGVLALALALTL